MALAPFEPTTPARLRPSAALSLPVARRFVQRTSRVARPGSLPAGGPLVTDLFGQCPNVPRLQPSMPFARIVPRPHLETQEATHQADRTQLTRKRLKPTPSDLLKLHVPHLWSQAG